MNFDIRSILLAFHVIVWINFCIMTLAWYNARSIRNVTGYWSFSQALYGIGTLLLVLRNIIPDFLSIVLANICLVGAQIAAQEGLARYMNKAGYMGIASICILAFNTINSLFFTYVIPSVTMRIVTFSVSIAAIAAINIGTVWKKGNKLDAPVLFLVIALGFSIIVLLVRAAVAIVAGEYPDLMYAGIIQAVGIIGTLLAYVSFSMALFWLVVQRLGREIQQQARNDSLTNIGNRRALDELLERKLPVKENTSIGILMLDIDRFKEINDRFGHQAGDAYLIEFAAAIRQEEECFFRFAGDEFVVVAYNAELADLVKKAEALRNKVEQITISWMEQEKINTTVSIGIAVADDAATSWDKLMKRADTALYKVKNKGGNAVMVEFSESNGC